ncbi:3',5'-bisphosphate nucleotidase [Russula earlei]|uniref:3',5'-bisphosphate nucleotidase n=1 Tax=Russula earlei TaxID=71964 RepID=A0ACC0U5C6_9AGAM|nr:3',5'-bisphosphate nucleotidase [Russula earlei]
MPGPFAIEQQVAIAAVRRACALTTTVFNKLVTGETLVKGDKSPVTVADYSAQAVINTILSNAFPNDPIVGEEDASDLRRRPRQGGGGRAAPNAENETNDDDDDGALLRARVVQLADDVLALPPLSSSASGAGVDAAGWAGWEEREEWGLGRRWGAEALLKAIDRGDHAGGRTGRFWTLDPIDGTKGFLRGGQYAICLALLVDARVELGVIGCPNLPFVASGPSPDHVPVPVHDQDDTANRGALFLAVRGHGAFQLPLLAPPPTALPPAAASATSGGGAHPPAVRAVQQPRPTPLSMRPLALRELSFLESVEKAHAALDTNARVAARLGVHAAPVRMDSQAKYAALVRGDAGGGVYLRLPVARNGAGSADGYREKIWDHAAGSLLVEEAGGVVSDARGRPLDFGLGRTLGVNFGVVAARKEVHAQVLDAVQAELAEAAQREGDEEGPARS